MLLRQIQAVLMSYVNRRVYQLLLLLFLLGTLLSHRLPINNLPSRYWIASVLLEALLAALGPGSAITAVTLYYLQAREQLIGSSASLRPQGRTAHLLVIFAIIIAIAAVITSFFWQRPNVTRDFYPGVSPAGVFVVALTFLTLVAWAAYQPWLLPVLAVVLILSVRQTPVHYFISRITVWWPEFSYSRVPEGMRLTYRLLDESQHTLAVALRWVIVLANIIALQLLARLAKPGPKPTGATLLIALRAAFRSIQSSQPSQVRPLLTPSKITSTLSRGRHRRFGVHSPAAPWILALGTGICLSILMLIDDRILSHTRVAVTLIMLTLLPGVLVATGWRERWASLGYESLLPTGRAQFIREIAIALTIDLAEFWLAAMVVGIGVLFLFSPADVTGPFFLSVVCSALMQPLWLGAIFLTSRFRQLAPYIVVLTATALLTILPIVQVWSDARISKLPFLATISVIELACGLILLQSALRLWRRADLA